MAAHSMNARNPKLPLLGARTIRLPITAATNTIAMTIESFTAASSYGSARRHRAVS